MDSAFKMAAKRTYCPRLWDEIFIDENGKVFACCWDEAAPYGDIRKARLSDLCNSKSAVSQRKQSLAGTLKCYSGCNLLKKGAIPVPPAGKKARINYSDLKRFKIRFGVSCNIKCIMCTQDHRKKEMLDPEVVKKNVDLTPFESVEMEGGEPLFMKASREFSDYAVSLGKKVSFLTNGLLINDAMAKQIARNSLFICISVNGATKKSHELVNAGSSWERVLGNIRKIRKYREKFGTSVEIQGHMTLTKENITEAPLFIGNFKKLGFDVVEFSHAQSSVKYFSKKPREIMNFKKEVEKAYQASKNKKDINLLGLVPLFRAVMGFGKSRRR